MTFEEMKNLSEEEQKKLFTDIDSRRTKAKTTNFATTYNAQIPKIASLLKGDTELATRLFDTYWKRNWAIKEIEKNVEIKTVGKQEWLYNPISKFWYFLENRKDVFSLLNQSTGNFVFNTFLFYTIQSFNKMDIPFKQQLQYHDECLFLVENRFISQSKIAFKEGMRLANEYLKMNVEFSYDLIVGKNYAEVH